MNPRTFSVLHSKKLKTSTYDSKSPDSAAKKIFNDLCGDKKKVCHKIVTFIDNHTDKVYKKKVERKVVNKTVMIAGKPILFKYATIVKSIKK